MKRDSIYDDKQGLDGIATLTDNPLAVHAVTGR